MPGDARIAKGLVTFPCAAAATACNSPSTALPSPGCARPYGRVATRLFISFDYDHDQDLRNALVAQARNPDSPFEIANWSVKEPMAGNWKAQVRTRIRQIEQVAVLCGHYTDSATGVSVEVEIAREEKKPYFLLAGCPTGALKKPRSALATDKVYNWTWQNLKALIAGAR